MAWPPATHQDVQDRIDSITIPSYWRSGYYSLGYDIPGDATNLSISTTSARLRPFLVLSAVTVDRIGVNVSVAGGAGSLIQTAIFAPGTMPGAKVLETATADSTTTGAKEWVISQTLTPGVWWVGVRTVTAACSIPAVSTPTPMSHFAMATTTPPISSATAASYIATVTGGTAGFPASGSSVNGSASSMPYIALRAA